MRNADRNRGPNKYPHWHDGAEWAKHTTMTRSRFLAMTASEFAFWVWARRSECDDVKAFFYAMNAVESWEYITDNQWLIKTCHPGLLRHLSNWRTCLIDTDENLEEWDH